MAVLILQYFSLLFRIWRECPRQFIYYRVLLSHFIIVRVYCSLFLSQLAIITVFVHSSQLIVSGSPVRDVNNLTSRVHVRIGAALLQYLTRFQILQIALICNDVQTQVHIK